MYNDPTPIIHREMPCKDAIHALNQYYLWLNETYAAIYHELDHDEKERLFRALRNEKRRTTFKLQELELQYYSEIVDEKRVCNRMSYDVHCG